MNGDIKERLIFDRLFVRVSIPEAVKLSKILIILNAQFQYPPL